MDTRDLFYQYGIQLNRRFQRKEKNTFLNVLGKNFETLGYKAKGVLNKKRNAVNLVIGDAPHAKTLVISYYDTPLHNFGNPMKYYPLDGEASFRSSFLPSNTPVILTTLLALFIFLVYGKDINFTTHFWFSLICVAIIVGCAVAGITMTLFVGNKVNMNRNTSGCVAALKIGEGLEGSAKDTTAFLMTDFGCSKHAGDYMIREELGPKCDTLPVILLDCLGQGDTTCVGYRKGHKKEAEELAACIPDAITVGVPDNQLKYTSFSFYPAGLLVCRGYKSNQSYFVPSTASKHDDTVDVEKVEEISNGIVKYLNKK